MTHPISCDGYLVHAVIDTLEHHQHTVQCFLQFPTPLLALTVVQQVLRANKQAYSLTLTFLLYLKIKI
jgi:hypothetical protein